MTGNVQSLTNELANATIHEIARQWDYINWAMFNLSMRRPVLILSESRTHMGRWIPSTRTLEISLHTVMEHPWSVVLEVLRHEMAHQYVDEVLGVHDETSHGETFRKVCERHGIDSRAAGIPSADTSANTSENAALLSKIARLLALAESPNEHEAQTAMNMAQKLMLKHNIDMVTKRADRDYTVRQLGTPLARVEENRSILSYILTTHFFVEAIWVQVWLPLRGVSGKVLEVCGSRVNVEMAEYVWSFVTHTADSLWKSHKKLHGIPGDKDRRTFLAGVMTGFDEKLDAEKESNTASGLVWVGDPGLQEFFRARHPRVRTIRSGGSLLNDAREHGRAAGRNIVLHKGIGGTAPAGGRLLGPGRS